jgi:hypothetical protein
LLLEHDPKAARRFGDWIAGRGRYPRTLDVEELRLADWERPTTSSPEELKLSRRIAEHLVKTKQFRYLTAEDVAIPRVAREVAGLSLEHPICDRAGRGQVDILIVDLRRSVPTLLAIEVKVRASLAPGRNPISQIIRYREALTATYGAAWKIETLVVAEHFHDAIIDEANQKGLTYRDCSRQTGRLKSPL